MAEEKKELMQNADCYSLIECIKSSIEMIMNVKIEELKKHKNL